MLLLIFANDDYNIFSVIFTSLFCMQIKTIKQVEEIKPNVHCWSYLINIFSAKHMEVKGVISIHFR